MNTDEHRLTSGILPSVAQARLSLPFRVFLRAFAFSRLIFLCLIATSLHADEQWILTTADFKSETVSVRTIDESGIHIPGAGGDERTIAMKRFLQLDRVGAARSALPKLFLHLAGGDRISGAPVKLSGESLTWKSPGLGELSFPLKQVRAIREAGDTPSPDDVARTEDVLTLSNGDTLRGIVSDITATAISIQIPGAEGATVIEIASISSADFASTPESGSAPKVVQQSFRLSLGDGSALSVESVQLNQRELMVRLPDKSTRAIPLSTIAGIEQINGPVIWLSSRTPLESVQIPAVGQRTFPTQMDRTVMGNPIRAGEREFSHGIGVHSYSRLMFAIEPGCKQFRTQFAFDGHQPWGDVTVRIKLDDRVAFEKANVVSGPISDVISLELGAAKTITLEVDYGENYDVQDRFNWIEPAFLRSGD